MPKNPPYIGRRLTANSIRGIRQRIQRYKAEEIDRDPRDHIFSLSREIATRKTDVATIPLYNLMAVARINGTPEVTNLKSYDERAQVIQQKLDEYNTDSIPIYGVIFQNGHK